MYYNRNFRFFLNYDENLIAVITKGSNYVNYDLFTCDVNFPV